jgi:hypothetical protein
MGSDTNMPAVFSISTRITVLFTGWTTSTTTQYILTLVFLFLLAIFNRFLGAFKFQLEQSWAHNDSTPALNLAPGHRKIPKAKLSPLPTYMRVNKDEDEDPEEPSSLMDDTDKSTPNLLVTRSRKCVSVRHLFSWKANGYWSLQKDGTRSLIETVRALIGYLLWVVWKF